MNGPNIPVSPAGRYTVLFNDITGAYSFSVATSTKSGSGAILKMALAPNPASGSLRVASELPAAGSAAIEVQNLLGQRVQVLAPVFQSAGAREQPPSLSGIAPGIYLVQLKAADHTQTSRLVVEQASQRAVNSRTNGLRAKEKGYRLAALFFCPQASRRGWCAGARGQYLAHRGPANFGVPVVIERV